MSVSAGAVPLALAPGIGPGTWGSGHQRVGEEPNRDKDGRSDGVGCDVTGTREVGVGLRLSGCRRAQSVS